MTPSQEAGLEEGLRAPEPLVADGDHLAVGQLIGLLQGGGGGGGGHLLLKVQGNIAQLLLDVPDNLPLGGGGERVAPLGEDLHQVVGKLTASQVEPEDGVGKSVTLVDGDGVGDAVTGVHHNAGGTAGGIQGEHSLDGDVHGGRVEGLEHDLGHLLPVGLGVEGGLSQEDGLLLGGNAELVVEGVMPDLLHVVPVGDDSMLNGVLQGEDTPLSTESSPTGTTWRRSGTTPSTTSSALPPRSSPSSSLRPPSTPRPTGRRGPRSCSRPSTCPPCTSPSRLCSPCTPPAVPPVSSWTPETVSPTVSPSTRVTLFPTPSSRRCPPPLPPPPWRSPTSFPTARSSPLATRGSGAPRPSSSPASWEWRPAASTRPPTTPS